MARHRVRRILRHPASGTITRTARAIGLWAGALGCLLATAAGLAVAAEPDRRAVAPAVPAPAAAVLQDPLDYKTLRYETAALPLIAGNSDIGFEFGVVGTLSRFGSGAVPYLWNMDLVLALSVKQGPSGLEIAQQSYQWNIDVPKVAGGRVRLNPQVLYYRTVNQLYFGLGNASAGRIPAGAPARYFQFDDRQAHLRELTRVLLDGPLDLLIATTYRYETPRAYPGSLLEQHAAAGVVRGARPLSLLVLAAGAAYDTRDSEVFTRSGSFHDAGLRFVFAEPGANGVRYGGAGVRLSTFLPLGGPAVLAFRGVADLEFGNVPFYDLYTGGVFHSDEMIGGSSSVRGVPDGRYSGRIKAFLNAELRALLLHFHLLGEQFHVGGDLLFDTGRLWSDYSFRSPLDGPGIGLKWGAGAGGYLQWGQAALFRVEVAYSPDAVSGNPGLPLGIYVEDGVMF